MPEHKYTDFGFRKVLLSEKQSFVDRVFSGVANKYDLMNDLMSFGVHRLWKKEFLKMISDYSGDLLDVAGGSGDISLGYLNKAQYAGKEPKIVLCDINYDMLCTARSKFIDRNILEGIDLVVGDAMNLPFADNMFDYVTIAFGIRNVADIPKALQEIKRVLKAGGKFLCLEFSQVRAGMVSELYEFYSFNVIPKIGKIVSDNEGAYQYLVESIKKFPSKEDFAEMIEMAGFKGVGCKSLSSGVVAIHWGYKL